MPKTIEIPIQGMDCAECTRHVKKALGALPGVANVEVFLASEKAVIQYEPEMVGLPEMERAVAGAGYSVPDLSTTQEQGSAPDYSNDFTRQILAFFGVVFGVILFIIVAGEWLGLIEQVTRRVPFPIGLAIVLAAGYPVFRNVVRAVLQKQIISHTLMSLGVLAALVIGEWATAAVVVFFMRVGDYAERFTSERARKAVKDLTALAPQKARLERNGLEMELPIHEVRIGEVVIVRPGEKIPVDGEVIDGQATIDQSAITGESMPVEAGIGTKVFAATLVRLGSLRVTTTGIGPDTTFGRVIKLVEEAEAHRAKVQNTADRFSAYYLPVVAGIAALTFIIRRDPMATAAVLVVACSCSFALATPIAMLASIGAMAKRGLIIKGGKYLEALSSAEVLLIDKTGTLTLGKPFITDIVVTAPAYAGRRALLEQDVLALAASAERFSEHPLAEAVRRSASEAGLTLSEIQEFKAVPGQGVRATIDGARIAVGNRRMLDGQDAGHLTQISDALESQGKTILFVEKDLVVIGILAATDTLRPEVPAALAAVYKLGIQRVEILTGDNEQAAAALVKNLLETGSHLKLKELIRIRSGLLPEDKIAVVKEYQSRGKK
jgi:P-type Cu+ transporter